jgi:hypothetical protein
MVLWEEILQRLVGVEVLFTVSAVVVVGVLGYLYGPYWGVRRVPGPPSIPFVGHVPLLAKYGPDVFSVLAKQYGPIFRSVQTSSSFNSHHNFKPLLRHDHIYIFSIKNK